MNTEKKLEYFTEAITKEVENKKHHIRRQMAAEMSAAVSQAIAKASAEAEAQVASCSQAIQKAINKRITEAQTQARRDLVALRESLITRLFDGIKADIISFTNSDAYESFLINNIQAALAQSKHPYTYVQLTPSDMRLSHAIQDATGLTPEPGEEQDLGGFKLLSANRGKVTEYTFRSRLVSAMEAFSAEVAHRFETRSL